METLKEIPAKSILYRGYVIEPFGMTEPEHIEYRGFIIERESETRLKGDFIIYPQSEGIQHDYDLVGESYQYCGNCLWADSVEEAKAAINDKIIEESPYHVVIINRRQPYYFPFLDEATKFASMWGGELRMYGQLIINP